MSMRYQDVVNNLARKEYEWSKFSLKSNQLKNIISFLNIEGEELKEVYYTKNIDPKKRTNLALICRSEASVFDPVYEEVTGTVPSYILIFITNYHENKVIPDDSFYKVDQAYLNEYNRSMFTGTKKVSLKDLFFIAKEKEMKIDVLLDGFLGD